MSSLAKLQAAKSLDDVAKLLGYTPSSLAYIIYKIPSSKKYSEFEIKKRSGGVRKIMAPQSHLKILQRRLAKLLYRCLADIDKAGPPRRPLSHGFARALSIVTNASAHKRRRYVLNLDLKDFFPTINFGRVRGVLIKDKRFSLDPKVATIIAQIACHDNALPQGSPCSPVLSNIVAHLLDIRLVRFAREQKCTYSRYADDITFSTNQATFPAEVALPVSGIEGKWELGHALASAINKVGFAINDAKTRMQFRGSRQLATGLLVNEKANIRPEYYRTVRSMCSALFNTGTYYRMTTATLLGGKVSDPDVKEVITSLSPLQGRIGHIYHVRDVVDKRASAEKKRNATATRVLYHRFLFYKNFIVLDRPLVISEGKTDVIYLRAAIAKLTAFHPKLGKIVGGKLKPTIEFLNQTRTVRDVLQLGGGTGDFKFFMLRYKDTLNRFKSCPLLHPVILLIDNDEGANEIFSVAKQLGIAGLSHKSTAPFYRIHANLYLVKTPESSSAGGKSCIEDLFDPSLLATVVDGKSFDPNKKHDEPGKYGKLVFAEKVVRPNASTINFDKFSLLLTRIALVLDDYASHLAATS